MKCIKDNYGFPVPEEFEELLLQLLSQVLIIV